MPAVVTDQFRILNASNFIDSILDTNNSYYVFVGLSNPTATGFGRTDTWNNGTSNSIPSPVDNLQYLSSYRDTSMFAKKVTSSNVRRVIKKHTWTNNTQYDMYRHDYSPGGTKPKNAQTLYNTNYYVINSDYRVYVCIDNGSTGSPMEPKYSLNEPTFTELEPSSAGPDDDYIWKYLFTVSPSDIIKFDSTEYIVLPNDWSTSTDAQIQSVRESANSDVNKNQIKKVYIENGGSKYTSGEPQIVDILGDGVGGKAQVEVEGGVITNVKVTSGGSGYTYGIVDLSNLNQAVTSNNGVHAKLVPIIPPSKGHGYDIYTELGADKVLIYSRFDDSTKNFPTDTNFSQVGIIKNPIKYGASGICTDSQFSSVGSIMLNSSTSGALASDNDLVGKIVTQTLKPDGIGTAKAYISSYDSETNVLKYIQDRSLYFNDQNKEDQTDYRKVGNEAKVLSFDTTISNPELTIDTNVTVSIANTFSGITTTIQSKQINLGVVFENGLANPVINKKTGDIIYIDNRKMVQRDIRQKEDIKIILEF